MASTLTWVRSHLGAEWMTAQDHLASNDHACRQVVSAKWPIFVRILALSQQGPETEEIQLRGINFEQLFEQDGVAYMTLGELDDLVFSTSRLRALLVEDKIAGFEMLFTHYRKMFCEVACGILYSYDLAQGCSQRSVYKNISLVG